MQAAVKQRKGAAVIRPSAYEFAISRHRASAVPSGCYVKLKGYTYKNGIMARVDTLYRWFLSAEQKSIDDMLAAYRRYQQQDDNIYQFLTMGTRTYHKLVITPSYVLDGTAAAIMAKNIAVAAGREPAYSIAECALILPNDYDTLDRLETWLMTIKGYNPAKVIKINPWRKDLFIPGVTDDIFYYFGTGDPVQHAILSRFRLDVSGYRVLCVWYE